MEGMDASRLRSRLCFASPELQSLTAKDVEDLAWSTKQRIVMALFQESPLLQDEYNSLLDLIDQRSKDLAQRRQLGPLKKDERIAFEETFRVKFLEILIQGLEKIKWPPAIEAFSNPLPGLQGEKWVFIDAINFMLKILYPQSSSIPTPSLDSR